MKKVLSLCITAVILIGLVSSCANPPGSQTYTDNIPQPADQLSTENMNAEPVDLSLLSDEELNKIDPALLNNLKTAASNVPIRINIRLQRPMDTDEFDTAVETQIKYNTEKRTEISAEITALKKQKDTLMQKSTGSEINANSTSLEEIDVKIAELSAEYESYSPVYNNCVNQVIAAKHRPLLEEFMNNYGLKSEENRYLSAAMTVEHISATPLKIIDIAKGNDVEYIFYPEDSIIYHEEDYALSNESSDLSATPISNFEMDEIYNLIDGEVAVSQGYRGYGIVIGMVETGVPDSSEVSGVTYCGSTSTHITQHATNVAKIIKKMVPNCTIIASSTNAHGGYQNAMTSLLENYTVNIVNTSYGANFYTTNNITSSGDVEKIYGVYTNIGYFVDNMIDLYNIPIVFASGNSGMYTSPTNDNYNDSCVSLQSIAPNSISVGSVRHSGIFPSENNSFIHEEYSSYNQNRTVVNKPEFCAPGDTATDTTHAATSYSTPFVTGTIAQMMSRNSVYYANNNSRYRDLMAKASLMASCFYNAGTTMNRIESGDYELYELPAASDYEGAGVINAGACYGMADKFQYENYSLVSYGTTTKGIAISDTTKPLRVAIAWRTEPVSSAIEFNNSNIMLHVCKEGSTQAIARSSASGIIQETMQDQNGPIVNYQYLEIPASTLAAKGAGNYIIKIIFNATDAYSPYIYVALAWSQYVNTDA